MTNLIFTVDLLDADTERELALTIEAGVLAQERLHQPDCSPCDVADLNMLVVLGQQAWEHFVAANMRLVQMIAAPAARRLKLDADELFQEGVLGLMDALMRWDCRRPGRFATFAIPWIRMRVQRMVVTRQGRLELPPFRARERRRVFAIQDALTVRLGRRPSAADIGREMGKPVAWVLGMLAHDEPVLLDSTVEVAQPISIDEDVVRRLHYSRCRQALHVLTGQERAVIERRFGFGQFQAMSYADVAEDLGVSTSTVRRRERTALARLREVDELLVAA